MWEGLVWEPGLPAMQAPRYVSYTAVMLSQASQLPHKPAPTFDWVYNFTDERPGFLVCKRCENTACKSSDALSSSRLSLLSM
ncbi:hypothetical protein EUX58_17515 [Pseudomonas sp. 770NI]|nr:hypothetical protein EUX58_17515 [Pseudomonas sp. 770NI]